MRKIIVGAQVSLDGVMQAPGGPMEDPTKGFRFGGWAMPHFDDVAGKEIVDLFKENCDLLLGRKTYEIFAAYWPYQDETGPEGVVAKSLNNMKKYVVSRSGDFDMSWRDSVLLRDVAEVKSLREQDGPNLITQGSTELVHSLLANDLVDTISTFTMPVVLGSGKKLWADGSVPHSYTLRRSLVSGTGVMIGHYERAGEVPIGNAAPDPPTEAELARRERMKREG
jgi:dihydrofolate reductase